MSPLIMPIWHMANLSLSSNIDSANKQGKSALFEPLKIKVFRIMVSISHKFDDALTVKHDE